MKLKTLVLFALIFALFSFKRDNTKLNGTWKLVRIEIVRSDTVQVAILDKEGSKLQKTWSNKYFMCVGSSIKGDEIHPDYFSGGTYKLSGNVYSEEIQYHSRSEQYGKTLQQYLKIKGDTLYQIYPIDIKGNYDKNNHYVEKYIRLD